MRTVIALIVVVLVGGEGLALAEKCQDAKARKDVATAKSLFDRGRYEEAIPLWEGAFEVCPSPDLLFNMAQAHRMLGHNEEAITLYRSWLREAKDPDPAVKKTIEDRVSELAALIAAQRKAAEKPPTGTVGTETTTTDRTPPDVKDQRPPTNVDGTGGDSGRATGGGPAPGSDESRPPAWYTDRWGLVLAATGVVTLGVGGGLFVYGGSLADDAANATDEADVESMIDSAGTYRTVGSVMLIAGAAVTVAGIVKLAIPDHAPARSSHGTDMAVGPGWIMVRGSF